MLGVTRVGGLDEALQGLTAHLEPPTHRRNATLPWFVVQSGRLHRYTYADYVALEESSSTKHEYERRLTLHTRTNDGGWETRVAIAGGKVTLPSLGAKPAVDELYRASSVG